MSYATADNGLDATVTLDKIQSGLKQGALDKVVEQIHTNGFSIEEVSDALDAYRTKAAGKRSASDRLKELRSELFNGGNSGQTEHVGDGEAGTGSSTEVTTDDNDEAQDETEDQPNQKRIGGGIKLPAVKGSANTRKRPV